MSALRPPKNIKVKGLCIYCTKCKEKVVDSCGLTGKKASSCNYSDKHKYKVFVYIPGTNGKSKSKLIDTRDEAEAIKQAIEFRKDLEENNYSSSVKVSKTNIPRTIVEGMAYYISYLNNETPHEQEHKERTKGHKAEVERHFRYFIEYLEKAGYYPQSLPINSIDKNVVGSLKSFLLETKNFAPKTYNKYVGTMRVFLSFLTEEFSLIMKNPFNDFKRLKTEQRINTISNTEFTQLLKLITPENGLEAKAGSQKRNYYKEWLKDAYWLALLTGRRREELVMMSFDKIVENEKGDPIAIQVNDFKVNRIQNVSARENSKVVFVPIISQLKELLYKLGYSVYKGTERYILAPEETMERKTIMDFLSKSFSHYYKQLGTGKEIQFYDLRKTYISHLYASYGERAKLITGHSGNEVMFNHYIDGKVVADVARDFGLMGE